MGRTGGKNRSGRRILSSNHHQQSADPTSGRRTPTSGRKRGSSFKPSSERGFRSVAPGSSSRLSRRHARDNVDGYGTLASYEIKQKRRTSKPAMGRKVRTKCAVAALNRRDQERDEKIKQEEEELLVLDDSEEEDDEQHVDEGGAEDEEDPLEEHEEDPGFQQLESSQSRGQPLFRTRSPSPTPTIVSSPSPPLFAEHEETPFDLELKPHLPPRLYARYLDHQHFILDQLEHQESVQGKRRVRFASPEADVGGNVEVQKPGRGGLYRRIEGKGKQRASEEPVEEEQFAEVEEEELSPTREDDDVTPQVAAWRAAERRQREFHSDDDDEL